MKNFFLSHNILKWMAVLVCCSLIFPSSDVAFATPTPTTSQNSTFAVLQATAGSWESITSPTTNPLLTVAILSPTSGWAGGDNILLRYNGVAWQPFSSPNLISNFRVSSISMISDTDGWLVGTPQINPYTTTSRSDAPQWNDVPSPITFALMSVSAVDATHVYTNGGGALVSPTCNDLLGWAFLDGMAVHGYPLALAIIAG